MNNIDLLRARDKVLATDPDDAEAVERTIKEIEPIANACKEYLEREDAFFERLMEILMKDAPKFRVNAYEDKETEEV